MKLNETNLRNVFQFAPWNELEPVAVLQSLKSSRA